MKLLVLSNVKALPQPLALLSPLVEDHDPDALVVLGGLFPPSPSPSHNPSAGGQPRPVKKGKKGEDDPSEVVTQLNWLTRPVFVVPDSSDLQMPKLVKKVQGQDLVFLRWIQAKGSPLDGWLFVGGGAGMTASDVGKLVGQYELLAPGQVIVLLSGLEQALLPEVANPALVLVGPSTPVPSNAGWVVQVGDVGEKGAVTLVDIEEKTTEELLVGLKV